MQPVNQATTRRVLETVRQVHPNAKVVFVDGVQQLERYLEFLMTGNF